MTPPQCIDMECFGSLGNWMNLSQYTAQLSNLVGGVMTPPYIRCGAGQHFKLQFMAPVGGAKQGAPLWRTLFAYSETVSNS